MKLGSESRDWCPWEEGGNLGTAHRKEHESHGGRDWRFDVATAEGCWGPRRTLPRACGGVWPASSLTLGVWPSRTGERIKACSTNLWVFVQPSQEVGHSFLFPPGSHAGSTGAHPQMLPPVPCAGTAVLWAKSQGPGPLLPVRPQATLCWALPGPCHQHQLVGPSSNNGARVSPVVSILFVTTGL